MKKLFISLILALIPTISYADVINTSGISAYTAPLIYLNSSKKAGLGVGGYGYFNIEKLHLFEGIAGFTYLSSTSPLYLENLALAYSNSQIENNSFRIGGNFLNSSLKTNDQGVVMFLGDNYSFSENFAAGFEGSVSLYNYYTNWKPVIQINPSITLTLGDFYSYGNFFLTLKGYYIKLPEEFAPGILVLKRNCFSGEASLSYNYFNIWNFSVFAWGGSQIFAVRNSGFSVFNSQEEHFAGYGISAKYALTENMALTVGVYNEHFKEQTTQSNSMMLSVPIFIDYNF